MLYHTLIEHVVQYCLLQERPADIFSLGYVMYFIQTKGGHPVGEVEDILTDDMIRTLKDNVDGLPETCKTVFVTLLTD